MDAFLQRQLFAQDVVFLATDSESAKVRDLVKTHGGVVLSEGQKDAEDARVNVVLLPGQDQKDDMLQVLVSRFPKAEILRAQWAHDSVQKNRRLSTTSYRLLQPAMESTTTGTEPPAKKQRVATPTSADFFSSSKPTAKSDASLPEPHFTPWETIQNSLYVLDARAKEQQEEQTDTFKIAGFDLDGTLIATKSGKKFAKDKDDWKLFHPTLVKQKLAELASDGFTLTIFSNQNGIAKGHITAAQVQVKAFELLLVSKLEAIVKQLKLPMLVFLGTENDSMRKPRLGAWKEMVKLLSAKGEEAINKRGSFYCGDAAGRPKITGRAKDFAATDYKFALNVGIRFFTPEDLFLGSKQRIHTRPDTWELGFDPKSIALSESTDPLLNPPFAQAAKPDQELVVLVGPPASGKSFFAKTHLSSYVIVSQDELRTAANCKKKCLEAIEQKKSVVIDNTNRDPRTRKEWIAIAKEKNLPVRCFEMNVDKPLSMHLNTFRSLTEQKKIPDVAIHGFYKNLVAPTINEGFVEVVKVQFRIDKNISEADQALLRTKSASTINTMLRFLFLDELALYFGELFSRRAAERRNAPAYVRQMSSKIKDGLFMGDMDAAQDADFLQLNGIVHIVNCIPRQMPNIFQQSLGLSYTACDLDEVLRRPFFDLKNREFTQIIQLIDRALERTESVLVHSLTGINRSPSIMIGYLMVKYCWGLDKAHEFVMTKRSDMKLHESYIDQLCSLEAQVQEDRPARATERQLYEWSTASADSKSDEVVLIHTFLNTASTSNTNTNTNAVPERRRLDTSKRHRGATPERRLTWIDQTPEMRKLHPSLLVRPERPPNNSYSKMTAANGWVDLLDPSPALAHQAKIKEMAADTSLLAARVAFADLGLNPPRTTSRYLDPSEPEFDLRVPSAAETPLVHNTKRLHSFSAPKRTEVLDDEASTSPSTVSEELDFEDTSGSTPRYLRETLASINSRPRRQSSSGPTRTASSTKRVSRPTNGRSHSSGAILGSTTSKETASKGVPKKTGRMTRTTPTTAQGGRVFYNVNFPPQSSTASLSSRSRGGHILTGSARRSVSDSQQSQSSVPARPRTAPPRTRRDVETRDLLQSKKVELGAFSQIAIDPKTYRLHSSLDFTPGLDANPTVSARGVRRTSTTSSTGYGRPKTARASWR
ncbi:Bifunctional polynucleotide phosphatase/kinase [Phytophthora citrophthora]|uniref:Bifunctional polynucleotide phosphatase/kinase n=1 Tax=Phytophthora citrophthora TaxID=4793 RepID=A0AAD9H0R3_9STRA|nr:Bifunctional polynucleotide phosphatase/kinase [Phytophthora citrophthora]